MSRSEPLVPSTVASSGELRQLWVSMMRSRWTSLAVVPASPATPTLNVTNALLDLGAMQALPPFRFIDARSVSLQEGKELGREIPALVSSGIRVVTAVNSVLFDLAGLLPIVAADAALLVVELGTTRSDEARSTIEVIGRERVLGCVVVHPAR